MEVKGKYESKVITLGEILDDEQLDFTDGGYIRLKEIDWQTDTVIVGKPEALPNHNGSGSAESTDALSDLTNKEN